MSTIVFTRTEMQELREALLQDEQERFAFASLNESGDRQLVTDVRPVADDEMEKQGRAECRPTLDLEREQAHAHYERGQGIVLNHSHPFSEYPGWSGFDRSIMAKMTEWLQGLYGPEFDVYFGLVGQQGYRVAEYDIEADAVVPVPVTMCGHWQADTPDFPSIDGTTATWENDSSLSSEQREQYDRVIRALSETTPQTLREQRVSLVGCGGLGSVIAEQLGRLGVGEIDLIDPDVVEPSNLPRLYGAYSDDVGRAKVDVLREHLKSIDETLTVRTHEGRVEDVRDVVKTADVVVAGLDRMSTRAFLNRFCIKHCLPYIDAGVVISRGEDELAAMEGFIQVVSPGSTACFACLDRLDREAIRLERLSETEREVEVERGYVEESALTPEPAVVQLNTTVAGMVVSEFVNLVTGIDIPTGFTRYEAVGGELSTLQTSDARDPSCHVCGEHGVLARGDADPESVDVETTGLDLDFGDLADANKQDQEDEAVAETESVSEEKADEEAEADQNPESTPEQDPDAQQGDAAQHDTDDDERDDSQEAHVVPYSGLAWASMRKVIPWIP